MKNIEKSNTNQHGNSELKDDEVVEELKKWISMSKYISEPVVFVHYILLQRILDLIDRQKAEIEAKDIEIDILIKKKDAAYDECEELKAEIESLKHNLECVRKCNIKLMYSEKTLVSEAIKEFAERLCEGRVSNDPVVIAVKTELKMTKK